MPSCRGWGRRGDLKKTPHLQKFRQIFLLLDLPSLQLDAGEQEEFLTKDRLNKVFGNDLHGLVEVENHLRIWACSGNVTQKHEMKAFFENDSFYFARRVSQKLNLNSALRYSIKQGYHFLTIRTTICRKRKFLERHIFQKKI